MTDKRCLYKAECEILKKYSRFSREYKSRVKEFCDTFFYLHCPAYVYKEKQKADKEKNLSRPKNLETKALAEKLIEHC